VSSTRPERQTAESPPRHVRLACIPRTPARHASPRTRLNVGISPPGAVGSLQCESCTVSAREGADASPGRQHSILRILSHAQRRSSPVHKGHCPRIEVGLHNRAARTATALPSIRVAQPHRTALTGNLQVAGIEPPRAFRSRVAFRNACASVTRDDGRGDHCGSGLALPVRVAGK
jgi:hypothetical protein